MNDKDFLDNGFKRCDKGTNMSIYKYRKELIDWSEVEQNNLDFIEIPALLFGDNGINSGFCIYTGFCYVWINATTIESAIDFANMIVSFEPL